MNLTSKRDLLFVALAGFFVTNAIVAELIGGKLIRLGGLTMSIGIIPWPVVFLSTDIINEFYGKKGVRRLSLLTAALILYAFIILFFGIHTHAASFSPVQDREFYIVFGQSLWIIAGSITAFLFSQFTDVFIFWMVRSKTGKKHLWLRSTGSTVISQLIDTFIVLSIAFLLPGKITFSEFINLGLTNYFLKLAIALLLTPFIYLGHSMVKKYLGHDQAETQLAETARESMQSNRNTI